MDKLAMWQLLRSIDDHAISTSRNAKSNDDRDWMQIFCEDVVRETLVHVQHPPPAPRRMLRFVPGFRFSTQPDMCKLLHSKVFRHSLFSDDTDTGTPPPEDQKRKAKRQRTLPVVSSRSREPSVSISRSRSLHPHLDFDSASARSRSRSLSISLEAGAKATTNGKKRPLTREVSMSKGFKRSKSSALAEPPAPAIKEKPRDAKRDRGLETAHSQVLVEDTPVKPIKQFDRKPPPFNSTGPRTGSRASSQKSSSPLDLGEGRSFVTDTPVKSGRVPRASLRVATKLDGDEDEDDDEWMIGSPSVRRSLASALTDEDVRTASP
jgi:hypothetical protein